MASPALLMRALHASQSALSLYLAYHSFIAIQNLRTYEEATKKAAKYSNTADKQLQQTRTTQAAGVAAILVSLPTSLTLLLTPASTLLSHRWALLLASPACALATFAARKYMQSYWAPSDGKTVGVRIPLPKAGDYNEAQKATQEVLRVLLWLEWSWVGAALMAGIGAWGKA